MRQTPNFTGWRATILHREDGTTEKLARHLKLLGLTVASQWAALTESALPEIILVDADQGWNGLLPWTGMDAPRPLVALLGSEAPGRIAWAMDQGAGAIIAKPLATSAIYPALVMAVGVHAERRATRERIDHLQERVRMRPLVYGAVQQLRTARAIGEDAAYAVLRNCAMQRRMAMEEVAALILGGAEPLPDVG